MTTLADLDATYDRMVADLDAAIAEARGYLAAHGLEATEYRGLDELRLGNADLADSCAWLPRVMPDAPQYVLPGHEHSAALATIERGAA